MEWRRGHVIGRGSSATISTATLSRSNYPVAVKSVELSQAMFLEREQKLLRVMKHPQIVGYIAHDTTMENNKLYYNILMELVPGGTLIDKIRKHGGRLDEYTTAYYTRQVLLGLEYLHSIGLAHCDIKGENILIGGSGAKIADFGCARRLYLTADVAMPIGGTPMFMAPEVARGEQQEFSADVWALGCTVIKMATGEAPWPSQTDPLSVLHKIAYSGESPEIPKFLSFEARDFLSKCFKIDAKERWTARQLLNHRFLVESNCYSEKHVSDFDANSEFDSPTSILDQRVWNSIPESENIHGMNKIDGRDLQKSRIGRLASSCEGTMWTPEESWKLVRSIGSKRN